MPVLDEATIRVVTGTGGKIGVSILEHGRVKFSAGSFDKEPAEREFLFVDAGSGVGIIARHEVGLWAARGGTGKGWSLMQMSVAIATGSTVFGWRATQGRVLYLASEEDHEEAWRRLYWCTKLAGVDRSQVVKNVDIRALRGMGVALTTAIDPSTPELPTTHFVQEIQEELQQAMRERHPYLLLALDPLSRFAGADVEKDNSAGTRFIQVAETFTAEDCGQPNVIIAHHVRKTGKDGASENLIDLIRGASGLVDGARWAVVLNRKSKKKGAPDLITLELAKVNYAPPMDPITLARPVDGHGTLRLADEEEVALYGSTSSSALLDTVQQEILTQLSIHPATSARLSAVLNRSVNTIRPAIEMLREEGKIVKLQGERGPWSIHLDPSLSHQMDIA